MVKFVMNQEYSPKAMNRVLTVPNLISFLRICSIPYIAWLITKNHMILALVVLAISAFSDCIDGYIARRWNQVSKLGQILDPIADRLLIIFSTVALAIASIIPWWALVLVVLRDVIMAALVVLLAQHDYGPLPVNFVGKAGTALIMLAIVSLMIVYAVSTEAMFVLYAAAIACGIWGIVLYWYAGLLYYRQAYVLLSGAKSK
ncbi:MULTISPECIES: CDP-alcohol phosphatidyltransferase family protein [Gardnerella]|uniref:CDP-diacylglycerol--glycerol-3-phosphate 3-phosphatidyltransferase n=1 Tax=Gardnerella vaginalis TaxID=2702 RepID=A0A3E1IPL9_GARVA|nr:CDP-alcohol phosphatidyltransferase family protein [Gardnerella vaginalis]EIK86982.1 CDP-diacylglycerol--glycerol-3- phosphate 3-phosphatidyl-transferase [Gardnerella vaginalis 6119V5]RFD74942.1 CDP-diacylglycerol--glycerol-3-phosphate 3-phosphatidyltransferase [Gardnerella vaginalis]